MLTSDVVDIETLSGLMLRYWGIGPALDPDEREVLLCALVNENRHLGGALHQRAAEALKRCVATPTAGLAK